MKVLRWEGYSRVSGWANVITSVLPEVRQSEMEAEVGWYGHKPKDGGGH